MAVKERDYCILLPLYSSQLYGEDPSQKSVKGFALSIAFQNFFDFFAKKCVENLVVWDKFIHTHTHCLYKSDVRINACVEKSFSNCTDFIEAGCCSQHLADCLVPCRLHRSSRGNFVFFALGCKRDVAVHCIDN